jgi:acylphosphatase
MTRVRTRVRVKGIVQGVGFRPFVHALAARLGLAGLVGNDAQGVFVEVEGPGEAVERFLRAVEREAPPLAVIEQVSAARVPPTGAEGFAIAPSRPGGERQALVSPDTATCAECLRELADPADRRHRYPFVNCTNCGPRFTIVRDVPYDRPATTMAGFAKLPRQVRARPEHRPFAEWLAGVLKREGLSQEAAARQLGVSVKTVSRRVGGETEPRLRDLRRIHEVFGEGPIA